MRPTEPRGFVNHTLVGMLWGPMVWTALAAAVAIPVGRSATPWQQATLAALWLAGAVVFGLLGSAFGEPVVLVVGLCFLGGKVVGHYFTKLGMEGIGLAMLKLASTFVLPGVGFGVPVLMGLAREKLGTSRRPND